MTITLKREYSILPQGDRDDFHHHIRDKGQGTTFHYACIVSLIVLVILLILAGVATLTASMFFSDGIKTTFGQLWFDTASEISSHMETTASDSSTPLSASNSNHDVEGGSNTHENGGTSSEENGNSAENLGQNNTSSHQHTPHSHNNSEIGGDGSGDKQSSSGESDIENSGNWTDSANGTMSNSNNATGLGVSDVNVEEMKEKFAEAMRNLEKNMEDIMGIRRAEFVVPIFMLACFLSFFSLISLCCCFMMRRRENRRKKLFGKLITDLQTGDSKTVLLNHSDLDD